MEQGPQSSPSTGTPPTTAKWLLGMVLLAAFAIRCYEITDPYVKVWEVGFHEVVARNHLRYGLKQTRLGSVLAVLDGENVYHLTHPPGFPLIIAGGFAVLGVSEWSARLIPIAFSMGTLILIYLIAGRLWSCRVALVSVTFASFSPISAYFGRIVTVQPAVLFFVLLLLFAYLRWRERGAARWYGLMIAAIALGGMIDWPFYVMLPVLAVHSLATRTRPRLTLVAGVLGAMLVGLLFVREHQLTGRVSILSHMQHRSDASCLTDVRFYEASVKKLIKFAPISSLLSLFFFWRMFRDPGGRPKYVGILLCLFLFVGLHLLMAPQGFFIHDWCWYYLVPGLAIAAALELEDLPWRRAVVAVFLVVSLGLTLSLHLNKKTGFADLHQAGRTIRELAGPDAVVFSQLVGPVAYYAEAPTLYYIDLDPVRFIRERKPEFLVISTISSPDLFSSETLLGLAEELGYVQEGQFGTVRLWRRGPARVGGQQSVVDKE